MPEGGAGLPRRNAESDAADRDGLASKRSFKPVSRPPEADTKGRTPPGKEVIRVVPGGIIGILLIIVLVLLILRLA
jgi:hypothetical protein